MVPKRYSMDLSCLDIHREALYAAELPQSFTGDSGALFFIALEDEIAYTTRRFQLIYRRIPK
jgi:hypothetical protein